MMFLLSQRLILNKTYDSLISIDPLFTAGTFLKGFIFSYSGVLCSPEIKYSLEYLKSLWSNSSVSYLVFIDEIIKYT